MSIRIKEKASPLAPPADYVEIFNDTLDGKLKVLDESGVTKPLGDNSADIFVGNGSSDVDSINDADTAALGGEIVEIRRVTVPAAITAQSVTKKLLIRGQGSGSVINGDLTFAAGSDGSELRGVKVNGDIIIALGVQNILIDGVKITIGKTVSDGGSNNLYTVLEEA